MLKDYHISLYSFRFFFKLQKFMKAVDAMITGMPNETDLRQDILRTGMNRFGATAQQRQQNNSIWQKNARQICSILHDVTLKNTVLQPER